MKCGICLITRLTPVSYIQEWIDWYLISIGFDKIWIYDGNVEGEEDISSVASENVAIVKWTESHSQLQAYLDFFKKQKNGVYEQMDWIVNFDDDEFLMIEDTSIKIKDILATHTVDSLGINLLFFGSSGLIRRYGSSQIDAFTMRTPVNYFENRTIKMIAKVDKVDTPNEMFTYNVRSLTRDIDSNLCTDFYTDRPMDKKIWVNHYFTRSREEFSSKIERGRADYVNTPLRAIGDLERLDKHCIVTDTRAIERKRLYAIGK